jgi:hypothetical protein
MARRVKARAASKAIALCALRHGVVSGCKFFNTLLNNPSEREKIERSDLIICAAAAAAAGRKPLDPPSLSLFCSGAQPILS